MNRLSVTLMIGLAVLTFTSAAPAQPLKVEGKGEEYHHAMWLEFVHAADHAKALCYQLSLTRSLNVPVAKHHLTEMSRALENARINHAMVHKAYDEGEVKAIAENHDALLDAHTKALNALEVLKAELEKANPNRQKASGEAAAIYHKASRAAANHLDVMKKIGIQLPPEPE